MLLPSPGTSTYSPETWAYIQSSMIQPNIFGTTSTITASGTSSFDTKINNDTLIRSVEILCKNQAFGDSFSISVVDVDGIYFPAGTTIITPIQSYNVTTDQEFQPQYEAISPIKLKGGVYIRFTYTSTGMTNVNVAINFFLLDVLF